MVTKIVRKIEYLGHSYTQDERIEITVSGKLNITADGIWLRSAGSVNGPMVLLAGETGEPALAALQIESLDHPLVKDMSSDEQRVHQLERAITDLVRTASRTDGFDRDAIWNWARGLGIDV